MPRSTAITVSAVVVIIGSAFALLCGAMMVLGSVFALNSSHAADAPVNLGYVLIIEAFFTFGFGAWGLASGIGLLKTKEWARISTLVYAAILAVLSVPTALAMALVPLPNTPSSNDPSPPFNIMLMVRVGGALVYALFAALGGFWLYFFNTQKVKVQFRGQQFSMAAGQAEGTGVPSEISDVRFGPDQRARPLSITIIGWHLIVSSAFSMLSVVFANILFSRLPLFFLGLFLFGPGAYLLLIVWMIVQVVAAVGLLKLKNWGLYATVALQCLALLNMVMIVAIPANRLRFQEIMESFRFSAVGRCINQCPCFRCG